MTIEKKLKVSIWVRNSLMVLSLIFVSYIVYIQHQYKQAQKSITNYKEERVIQEKKFDSLSTEYKKLEVNNSILENKIIKGQHEYDSLKSTLKQKEYVYIYKNLPVLNYSPAQLDEFWSGYGNQNK